MKVSINIVIILFLHFSNYNQKSKEIFQYLSSAAGISSYFDDKLVELRNKKVVPTNIPEIKQEQKISSDHSFPTEALWPA